MALSKLLLLQALFFSLLLLIVPSQCKVPQASTGAADSSGFLCKKSDKGMADPCQISSEIVKQPPALSQARWEAVHKGWLTHVILGLVFGIVFLLVSSLKHGADKDSVPHDEENPRVPNNAAGPAFPGIDNVQFTFKEIEKITEHFGKQIGEGGFGIVYRGQISGYGIVAVKRHFKPLRRDLERAFDAELAALSKTCHPNVVSLIGYCTENNERVLVYEYLSRKDLYGHLHPAERKSDLFSSWKLRVKVLLDAAKGIEYLHKNCEQQIIQRDIKSANILIDKNWVAKISDFGFAVLGPEPEKDCVELEVRRRGTDEYVDPEYRDNRRYAFPRNDVYSFGVVMLEVVTGKPPVVDGTTHLVNHAVPWIQSGNFRDVMDKRFPVPEGSEMEAVSMVAQLATQCVKVPGVDRLDMTYVVTGLKGALELFDT